jgi:hypothetical protein
MTSFVYYMQCSYRLRIYQRNVKLIPTGKFILQLFLKSIFLCIANFSNTFQINVRNEKNLHYIA